MPYYRRPYRAYQRRYAARPYYRRRRAYTVRRPYTARRRFVQRRPYRRRATTPYRRLTKKVTAINRKVSSTVGTQTWKWKGTEELACGINEANYTDVGTVNLTYLNHVVDNVRVFNPIDGDFEIHNLASAVTPYQRQIYYKNYYTAIDIKNNYLTPAEIRVYYCKVIDESSVGPSVTFTNGVADQVRNDANTAAEEESEPQVYPTEIDQFLKNWKVVKTKIRTLPPGHQMHCSWNTGPITYDPNFTSPAYQEDLKGFAFLVRIQGVIAHGDEDNSEITTSNASVDIIQTKIGTVTYDAGAPLKDIRILNQTSASITGGTMTVSQRPVAGNQVTGEGDIPGLRVEAVQPSGEVYTTTTV